MPELIGMDRLTGLKVAGIDHLKQSIADILTTRKGSRRMRMEYGSDLPSFIDMPLNQGWASAIQAEIVTALGRWEPRIKLSSVKVVSIINGKVGVEITGEYQGDTTILDITL